MITTALLLAHFAAIADAPGGVARLRQLILQLAVQGRLVEQDPDDEPASVLLQKILHTKEQFKHLGKDVDQEPLPPVDVKDYVYALPPTWQWVRLGEVILYNAGAKVEPTRIPANAWLLELEDIEKDTSKILQRISAKERQPKSNKCEFQPGDVLYGKLRPYLNKVVVADQAGYCTTEIVPLRGYCGIEPYYLMLVLKTPYFLQYVNSKSYGVKMPRLGTDDARQACIPLPPLAEQRRIVARVDALMALCDALEARQAQRGEERRRLLNTLVNALLGARDAGEAAAAWQRLSDSFALTLDAPEDVAPLRQAVLQLAVQGRLVEQDTEDEPASVLLGRVSSAKAALIAANQINKPAPLPQIAQDELLFPPPLSWQWERLGNLAKFLDYRGHTPPKTGSGIRLITAKNVRMGFINEEPREYISEETYVKWTTRGLPRYGDVLFTTEAPLGKVAQLLTHEIVALAQRVIDLQPFADFDPAYLKYVLMSPLLQDAINDKSSGITATGIKASRLKLILIPIPPLAEQRRIVARVEQLMALCDGLEARLREERAAAERLAEGLCAAVAAERPTAPARGERRASAGAPLAPAVQPTPALDLDAYATLAAWVVRQHQGTATARTLGHVKLEKIAHLGEAYAGVDLGRTPQALPRGPADFALLKQVIVRGRTLNAFDAPPREGSEWGYQFVALPHLDALADRFADVFGAQAARLGHLVALLVPLKSRHAEAVATLYAVWNDLLHAGQTPDDDQIFAAFRAFHPQKEHFAPEVLTRWLGWMRSNGIVPDGSAKLTLPSTLAPRPQVMTSERGKRA